MFKKLFSKWFKKEMPGGAEAVWQPLIGEEVQSPFAQVPEIYEAVSFIAQNATQAEMGIFRFKDNAEVFRDEKELAPLFALLQRPNPEMDLNLFLEFVYGYLAYHREAFILKVKSRGQAAGTRNLPAQLWPVNPAQCVALDKDGYGVKSWSINGFIYPAEQVIHIRYFNPDNSLRSLSPIKPLSELIKANMAAMKSNRAFYENNSQTPFILGTDKDLTQEQLRRIIEGWESQHKGAANKGRTGFLSGGMKPYALNTNSGTSEFVENSKNTSERILAGLQMQKSLLNMTDTTNYATYMGQLRTFWQNVIRPMVRKVESALNTGVVWPYAPDYELRFKYDNVEAFTADFADKVKTAQTLTQMGLPLNAVCDRLNLGFDPVDWGDEWWINFGLVPASDYGTDRTASEEKSVCICHTKSAEEQRKEIIWKRFDREQLRTERLMGQKMGRFFMEQGSRLKRAAKNGELGQVDWTKEDEALKKMFLPVVAEAVEQGIKQAAVQLDKACKADLSEAAKLRYLGKVAKRILNINKTTREKTEQILQQGLTEGETHEEIAQALAEKVLGGFKTRARLIARTESTGALNGGTAEYLTETGAGKIWLSARDGNVRESHVRLDGEKCAANGVFSNGLAFPGDPDGADGAEVCNCRCTLMADI